MTAAKLTAAQRKVLNSDDLSWVGWDVMGRPVVFFGSSPQSHQSILRNGDFVDATSPIAFFDRDQIKWAVRT